MYDLIGDVNGEGRQLRALLHRLGYRDSGGLFCHPERKCLFTGGLIDRGGQVLETLELVQAMVQSGEAECVLGRPEFNALCFHHTHGGTPLRAHTREHYQEHLPTLRQVPDSRLGEFMQWFFDLPVWIEKAELRLVHACWDKAGIDVLRESLPNSRVKDGAKLIEVESGDKGIAMRRLLSGITITLPPEAHLEGRDGQRIPIRWYANPQSLTYSDVVFGRPAGIRALPLNKGHLSEFSPYAAEDLPLFFGHYRLAAKEPALLTPNVCCVDYSGGGMLVAYRFRFGEPLASRHFLKVSYT